MDFAATNPHVAHTTHDDMLPTNAIATTNLASAPLGACVALGARAAPESVYRVRHKDQAQSAVQASQHT